MQNTWTVTLVLLLLELLPFVYNFHVHSITLKPLDIFSWNFTLTFYTIRGHAEHMNSYSGFPTFGVIAFCVLTIFVSAP